MWISEFEVHLAYSVSSGIDSVTQRNPVGKQQTNQPNAPLNSSIVCTSPSEAKRSYYFCHIDSHTTYYPLNFDN